MTIAGSDPSGGAGLQADLKTFQQHAVYGASVVTLLTVQNTVGVDDVQVLEPAFVRAQLGAVLSDIPPHAAKVGALGNASVVNEVAHAAASFSFPLVVDPVMISKHGAPLLQEDGVRAMHHLVRHCALVTPNVPEAEVLIGQPVRTLADASGAAKALADKFETAVLLKGGHLSGDEAIDILVCDGSVTEHAAPRIPTTQTHGTGCTYSAAITARLAEGHGLIESVKLAKTWLTEAIRRAPGLGAGVGPLDHTVVPPHSP